MPSSIDLRSPSISDSEPDDDALATRRARRPAANPLGAGAAASSSVQPGVRGARRIRTAELHDGPDDHRGLTSILNDRRRGAGAARAQPTASGSAAAPVRHRGERVQRDVLDAEGDSDSDDGFEITGANMRNRPQGGEFQRALRELDRAVAQAGRFHEVLLQDEPRRRPRLRSPPPPLPDPDDVPAPPRRIGLGGAVLRAGNRHVNFAPIPPRAADDVPAAAAQAADPAPMRVRARHVPRPRHQWPDMNPPLEFRAGPAIGGVGGINGQLNALYAGGFRLDNNAGEIGLGMGMPRGIFALDQNRLDAIMAQIGVGVGEAGRAPFMRPDDVQNIIASVPMPTYSKPRHGFSANFEVEESAEDSAIVVDEDGMVVSSKNKAKKPHLVCAHCSDPLMVSGAYRSPLDRVWALRCGHMIDQKCLDTLSMPKTEKEQASVNRHPEILDEEPPKKKGRRGKKTAETKEKERLPDEYTWVCPVEGCEGRHVSVEIGGVWVGKDGQGAVAVYA